MTFFLGQGNSAPLSGNHSLSMLGEAYRPVPSTSTFQPKANFTEQNAKDLVDAESVDFNASIHGSWTIENAKSKLHQYLQENRITADYKYNAVGPDHNK